MDHLSWSTLPATGMGSAVCLLLVSKENSWDSKSDPAQPEDPAGFTLLSQLHLGPKLHPKNEPEFRGEALLRSQLIFKVKFLPFIIY